MRKLARTNDATAIAISAAIGAVETDKSQAAVDQNSDAAANSPALDTESQKGASDPVATNHSEISTGPQFTVEVGSHEALADHASTAESLPTDIEASRGRGGAPSSLTVSAADVSKSGNDDILDGLAQKGAHLTHTSDTTSNSSGFSPTELAAPSNEISALKTNTDGIAQSEHGGTANDPVPLALLSAHAPSTDGIAQTVNDPVPLASISAHSPSDASPVDFILTGGDAGSTGTGTGTSTGTSTPTGSGAASSGLIINVSYDASVSSAPAAFKTVVDAVVSYLESKYSDPVTIRINVGYGEVNGLPMNGGAIGQSIVLYRCLLLRAAEKCIGSRRVDSE